MSEYCGDVCHHTKRRGKLHRCGWCGQLIEIGERYAKWLWIDCRERDTIYAHAECREAWAEAARIEGGIAYASGDYDRPAKEKAPGQR